MTQAETTRYRSSRSALCSARPYALHNRYVLISVVDGFVLMSELVLLDMRARATLHMLSCTTCSG